MTESWIFSFWFTFQLMVHPMTKHWRIIIVELLEGGVSINSAWVTWGGVSVKWDFDCRKPIFNCLLQTGFEKLALKYASWWSWKESSGKCVSSPHFSNIFSSPALSASYHSDTSIMFNLPSDSLKVLLPTGVSWMGWNPFPKPEKIPVLVRLSKAFPKPASWDLWRNYFLSSNVLLCCLLKRLTVNGMRVKPPIILTWWHFALPCTD